MRGKWLGVVIGGLFAAGAFTAWWTTPKHAPEQAKSTASSPKVEEAQGRIHSAPLVEGDGGVTVSPDLPSLPELPEGLSPQVQHVLALLENGVSSTASSVASIHELRRLASEDPQAFLEIIEGDFSVDVKRLAAVLVADHLKDAQVILRAIRAEEDESVRVTLLGRLKALTFAEGREFLLDLIESQTTTPPVKAAALPALAQVDPSGATELALTLLGSESRLLEKEAASFLAGRNDVQVAGKLLEYWREQVVRAGGVAAFANADAIMHEHILESLGRMSPDVYKQVVREFLARRDTAPVRGQFLLGIRLAGEDVAFDVLTSVLTESESNADRVQAAYALANFSSERSAKHLFALLSDASLPEAVATHVARALQRRPAPALTLADLESAFASEVSVDAKWVAATWLAGRSSEIRDQELLKQLADFGLQAVTSGGKSRLDGARILAELGTSGAADLEDVLHAARVASEDDNGAAARVLNSALVSMPPHPLVREYFEEELDSPEASEESKIGAVAYLARESKDGDLRTLEREFDRLIGNELTAMKLIISLGKAGGSGAEELLRRAVNSDSLKADLKEAANLALRLLKAKATRAESTNQR